MVAQCTFSHRDHLGERWLLDPPKETLNPGLQRSQVETSGFPFSTLVRKSRQSGHRTLGHVGDTYGSD